MVIYLPVALLKDCVCSFLGATVFRNFSHEMSVSSTSTGLDIPLRINELQDGSETDLQSRLLSAKYLSEREEGGPLLPKNEEDDPPMLEDSSYLHSWDIAKCSLYLTPVWFLTEVKDSSSYHFLLKSLALV